MVIPAYVYEEEKNGVSVATNSSTSCHQEVNTVEECKQQHMAGRE